MDSNLRKVAPRNTDGVQVLGAPKAGRREIMGIDPAAMGHIVARLTDLYSNPLEAAIREPVSNAIDATVAAGTSSPIELTGPSQVFPYFQIVDHGLGMTEDEIFDIYAKYGTSTKDLDFGQVGAYGLGAKAPLAYTRSFTGESTKNGITTKFSISREETGNVVEAHGVENTGAESGTLIKIPVASFSDYDEFNRVLTDYKINFGSEIIINGKTYSGIDDNSIFLGVHNINGVDCKVWLENGMAIENVYLITDIPGKNDSDSYARRNFLGNFSLTGVLGGWKYSLRPKTAYGYGYGRGAGVELKIDLAPGMVDFSSSRDEITKNERVTDLVSDFFDKFLPIEEPLRAFNQAFKKLSTKKAFASLVTIINKSKSGSSAFDYSKNALCDSRGNILFTFEDVVGTELIEFMNKTICSDNSSVISAGVESIGDGFQILSPDYLKNGIESTEKKHIVGSIGSNFWSFKKMQGRAKLIESNRKDNFFRVLFGIDSTLKNLGNILVVSGSNSEDRRAIYAAWKTIFQKISLLSAKEKASMVTEENLSRTVVQPAIIFIDSPIKNKTLLNDHFSKSMKITFVTASDLLGNVKKIQKVIRLETKKEKDKLIAEGVISGHRRITVMGKLVSQGYSSLAELSTHENFNLHTGLDSVDSGTLEAGAIFVFYKRSEEILPTLYGAANAGEKILNKKIYVISSDASNLARLFAELGENNKSIFFSNVFKPRSAASKKAMEGRVFKDIVVKSALSYSREEIIYSAFAKAISGQYSVPDLSTFAEEAMAEFSAPNESQFKGILMDILARVNDPDTKKIRPIDETILPYALEKIDKNTKSAMDILFRAITNVYSYAHFYEHSYSGNSSLKSMTKDSALLIKESLHALVAVPKTAKSNGLHKAAVQNVVEAIVSFTRNPEGFIEL